MVLSYHFSTYEFSHFTSVIYCSMSVLTLPIETWVPWIAGDKVTPVCVCIVQALQHSVGLGSWPITRWQCGNMEQLYNTDRQYYTTAVATGANSRSPPPPTISSVRAPSLSSAVYCIDLKNNSHTLYLFKRILSLKLLCRPYATRYKKQYVWKFCLEREFGRKCLMFRPGNF